jgi:hypothetical protein
MDIKMPFHYPNVREFLYYHFRNGPRIHCDPCSYVFVMMARCKT